MRIPVVYILSVAYGLVALYAGLFGAHVLFISNARIAAITLAISGFLMCSFGSVGVFVSRAPTHPLSIGGYVLGAVGLLTLSAQLLSLQIPYLSNLRIALLAVAAVIVLKVIIAKLDFVLSV